MLKLRISKSKLTLLLMGYRPPLPFFQFQNHFIQSDSVRTLVENGVGVRVTAGSGGVPGFTFEFVDKIGSLALLHILCGAGIV